MGLVCAVGVAFLAAEEGGEAQVVFVWGVVVVVLLLGVDVGVGLGHFSGF